jgi:hypothetical protein
MGGTGGVSVGSGFGSGGISCCGDRQPSILPNKANPRSYVYMTKQRTQLPAAVLLPPPPPANYESAGKVVSEGDMVQDITLMKCANFNAVRASHYPNIYRW